MWYRVFCRRADQISPEEILAMLHAEGPEPAVRGEFAGDDLGWTSARFHFPIGGPVEVQRFLTREDDLRNDLNTWAGYLETLTYAPAHVSMMERVIQTEQLLVMRMSLDLPNESAVRTLCTRIALQHARERDGIYQVENDGWYTADGELRIQEY